MKWSYNGKKDVSYLKIGHCVVAILFEFANPMYYKIYLKHYNESMHWGGTLLSRASIQEAKAYIEKEVQTWLDAAGLVSKQESHQENEPDTLEYQINQQIVKALKCCGERPAIQYLGWVGDINEQFDVVRLCCPACTTRSGVHRSIKDAVDEWNTMGFNN
jgi:hypothetical protein